MNHIGKEIPQKISNGPNYLEKVSGFSKQHTLNGAVNCVGTGLHSGVKVSLTLRPAEIGAGIVFFRSDIPGSSGISASWENVVDTRLCTTIGNNDGLTVSTIEHLMSAFAGCGVDNVYVDVNGPEVPVMDGSAQPFISLIECAGLLEQDQSRRIIEILKPVRVEIGDKVAELVPNNNFSIDFEIDFDNELVSRQKMSIELVNGTFKRELARARTFGFMHEVEKLRAAGLGLGGSLDNAVIVEGNKILNEDGLRYEDEFVRHKVLDAIGDLYTAGGVILGSYKGICAGHALTNQLLRALFADSSAWRDVSGEQQIQSSFGDFESEASDLVAING